MPNAIDGIAAVDLSDAASKKRLPDAQNADGVGDVLAIEASEDADAEGVSVRDADGERVGDALGESDVDEETPDGDGDGDGCAQT